MDMNLHATSNQSFASSLNLHNMSVNLLSVRDGDACKVCVCVSISESFLFNLLYDVVTVRNIPTKKKRIVHMKVIYFLEMNGTWSIGQIPPIF